MEIDFYKNKSNFCKDIPGIDILLSDFTIKKIFDWFNKEISAINPDASNKWQKEKPKEPCVFMSKMWNKSLGMFDYKIGRFEKIKDDDGWDDIERCNYDEYYIIEYFKD